MDLGVCGFGVSCMAHAACVRIHRGLMPSQITRYRKFSTIRFGFLYLVYLVIASRSIRRLVYDTSRTARLRSPRYVSMVLRSGVTVGRKTISGRLFQCNTCYHPLCSISNPTSGKLPFTVKAAFDHPHTSSQSLARHHKWQVLADSQVRQGKCHDHR